MPLITDEHEAYLAVTEQLYATQCEVKVSLPDTKWFWELFPTVLHWRSTNIRVVAFTHPVSGASTDDAKELQRRQILVGMGIEVVETPDLPFHGILLDPPNLGSASAVTFVAGRSDYEPAARFYSARLDHAAVVGLHARLAWPLGEPRPLHTPRLRRMDPEGLLSLLRENVHVYRDPSVQLEIEEVPVSKVWLISRFVRAFRYKQIGSLFNRYQAEGLDLFEPAEVLLDGGSTSVVTPPVLEKTAESYVAVEGNTRFLYCLHNGIPSVRAVVARGVRVELPGKPVPLQQVRITTRKRDPHVRMEGFNYKLFRPIERAVRPLAGPR